MTTARAVAKRLGIDDVHGEVKPADKRKLVVKLQVEGRIVALAGEGVNDAPAFGFGDRRRLATQKRQIEWRLKRANNSTASAGMHIDRYE